MKSHTGRVLYAATHGRGVWSLALPPAPAGGGGGGGGGGPGNPSGAIQGAATLELGQTATYSAIGSTPNGGSVTFSWTLPGKPSTATGTPVSFAANKLGVQSIVLTVTDSTGAHVTVTQAVTVKDTKKATIKLKKIRTGRVGHRTTVRGTITDASGIKTAKLFWGDRSNPATLHLGRRGGFAVRHRYKSAKRFTLKVKATDRTRHTASKKTKVRIRQR